MPKFFPITIKKIVAAVSGAANFLASTKPAVRIWSRARIVAARIAPAVAITNLRAKLRSVVLPGVALTTFVSGATQAQVAPGIAIGNRATGTAAKPQLLPAANILQSFVNLVRTAGASSVTEEAVGGRTDWASDANATGKHNGSSATITGNTLGARGGKLVLSYPASFDKTALTITKVELRFYCSQSGTSLGNGTLAIGYRVSGGGDVQLAAYTGNVNFLTTPATFDMTSIVGGDWAVLDTIKSYASFNAAALNTSSAALDAVELYVEANRTEVN